MQNLFREELWSAGWIPLLAVLTQTKLYIDYYCHGWAWLCIFILHINTCVKSAVFKQHTVYVLSHFNNLPHFYNQQYCRNITFNKFHISR
jgi:hypothetical protein